MKLSIYLPAVLACTLSADGGQLAVAHAEQRISIYDALTLRPLEELTAPGDASGLALTADQRTLLVTGAANEGHLLKPSLLKAEASRRSASRRWAGVSTPYGRPSRVRGTKCQFKRSSSSNPKLA